MPEEVRTPAPDPLRRVQDFINSEDLELGTDDFASPDAMISWLASRGLMSGDESGDARDLKLGRTLRSALRELVSANSDGSPPPDVWEVLNGAVGEADLTVRFGPDGAQLVTQVPGVRGALGRLLADVYTAMENHTWSRLKVCRNTKCGWAFYDRSKNRSSAWCTMAVCGNRAKTRAYRHRTRTALLHAHRKGAG